MAAAAILDNCEWPYLRNSSPSTYIARIERSSLRQHSSLVTFVNENIVIVLDSGIDMVAYYFNFLVSK